MNEQDVRRFIEKTFWRYAKTMPENPHEYALRRWCDGDEFNSVIEFIRDNGYEDTFGGRTYTYYEIDGHIYWTMGAPVIETILINRARV